MGFVTSLRIGPRLGLSFGILLLLIVGMAATGFIGAVKLFEESKTIYEDRAVPLGDLSRIDYLLQRNRVLVLDMLVQNSPEVVQRRIVEFRKNKDAADKHWQAYRATALRPEEEALANAFALARQTYETQGLDPAAAALEAGGTERALELYRSQISPLAPATAAGLHKLLQLQIDVAAQEFRKAEALQVTVEAVMVIATIVAGVLGAVLSVLITRSITGPLSQALRVAQRVAQGDLGSHITTSGKDEIAGLLRALGTMNVSLARIVAEVRQASDSIATGSAQIATGNADLSQRTEEQASNLEETAASMEQLTATVKQNADTARQASSIAHGASMAATRGGEMMGQVVVTMQEITGSSQKIADIIAVIDGIAFQTNILALNAAVEAARAGEQGRGFAVVAGEVRTLAQRSSSAAKEIKELISASVERVEAGSTLVAQAGHSVDEIVQQVRRVTDLISEITAASQEQASGISQVGEAVQQLDQVTQQNAALVEESAAAADSLKHQAARLAELVRVFKLENEV